MSAKNLHALKRGAYSRQVILPGEKKGDYRAEARGAAAARLALFRLQRALLAVARSPPF
jgi:hypothetical protein